ncbi:MAG: hypothetical protein RI973_2172, partial [Bacteroidota bacterium]
VFNRPCNMSENLKTNQEKWIDEQSNAEFDPKTLRQIWNSTEGCRAGYEPDVESGFKALRTKLHSRQHPPRRHQIPGLSITPLRTVAAAAAVLLLTATFVFRSFYRETADLLVSAAADHGIESIKLEDGSSITLNQGASISYPERFSGKERKIMLEGEAFFKVEKDAGRKFVVETNQLKVEVLGTSFGVMDSKQSRVTEVYVHSGKVAVGIKGSAARIELSAGEKLRYEENARKAMVDKQDLANTLGWKHGVLRFSNARLPEIFDVIERQFGQHFEIESEELSDCPFTLIIEKDKLEESLSAISKLCPIQFKEASQGHFTVSGECCK